MPTITFNGESFIVDHAVKGSDYVHGYDANSVCVIALDGVSDFSGITYDGTYMAPGECLAEVCNDVKYCGGTLKTAGEEVVPSVMFTEQSLSAAQKAQVQKNIGINEDTYIKTETLEITPVVNDHNSTGSGIDKRDYTYTVQNINTHGYPSFAGLVAKPGELQGGLLRVEWDTEELGNGNLQLSLFLFDADGNPYKHTGYGDGSGAGYFGDDDVGFTGDLYEPTYVDPAPADNPAIVNAGYSYGTLLAPFTTQIPEGCTVMVFVRCVTYPCGNFADRIALGQWLYGGGIKFTVEKTVEKNQYVSKNLGVVNANKLLVTDAEGNVVTMDSNEVSASAIPDYWTEYLDEKIATIKGLQEAGGRDCFSFGVIADLHYSENKAKISPLLAKYVMDACDIKYLLCLGDMQTQAAVTDESVIHSEWVGIKKMFAPIADRTLMTLGNHDGAWGQLDSDSDGTVDKYYCYNLTPETLHEYCYRPVGNVPGVTFDKSGNGFYVDDPASQVRYIILNTSCTEYTENEDGTAVYGYMTYQRLGQAQVNMVVEALRTVPGNEWGVVIGSHIPLTNDFEDGYVGDRDSLMTILEAYQNKESDVWVGWTGTDEGNMGWSVAGVDFTYAKGSIVGAFAGHLHADMSNTENAFPLILTDCDAEPTTDATHELGTTTEQSFDIFTVNRKTGVIYATKIGFGSDRTIEIPGWSDRAKAATNYLATIPAGGTAGQIISLNENGRLVWIDAPSGGVDALSAEGVLFG